MTSVSIFYGSVYGNAQNVAQEVCSHLQNKNIDVTVIEEPTIEDFKTAQSILVISSTTGQGDVPPNLEWAIGDLKDQSPDLTDIPFAVAALGDSSYGESYCGAGKQIFELLNALKAKPLTDIFLVDGIESFDPEDDVIKWLSSVPGF